MPKKLEKKIPSLNVGWVKTKKGYNIGSITLTLKSPYGYSSDEDLLKLCHNLVKPVLGAWRVKPCVHKCDEVGDKFIRCRFFVGKPKDFEGLPEAGFKTKE